MSSKIDKIIARLQSKITEQAYYEAQQQTRVVAARYIKSTDFPSAINILSSVASSLLAAHQGGSGGDLSLFLIDVYKTAQLVPDAENKGRLLGLLRQFDSEEPTRKKFVAEMIGWSARFGTYPAGDPELHAVVGALYAKEGDVVDAERHLVLGTRESASILAATEIEWWEADEKHTAQFYAGRGVLPYLLLGNVRDANTFFGTFVKSLVSKNPQLAAQNVQAANAPLSVQMFPSLPLLNFLSFLLLAVEKGTPSADLFRALRNQYREGLKEAGWEEALDGIAEIYFGIQRPRMGNPLMDMMGSMFGGGGAAQKKQPPKRRIGANQGGAGGPVAEGLD